MISNGPEYSIIIPTYRRVDPLRRCLEAIASIEFPRHRFEVIVVDDGSAKPPADVVASFSASLDVQLLCASHGGPAHARNTGARHARGRVLVFTDDDCLPRRDWLSTIDNAITARRDPVAIGGRVVNVLDENVFAAASQGIVDFLYDYYREHPAPWRFFTSNNIALPRAEFIEIGGFDEGFERAAAEDRDLCERWRGAGFDLQYEPRAVVGHAHKLGFARFNRQHFVYGRGAFDLHRSRARRGSRSLRLEPVRFYLGLVGYPLRRSSGPRSVVLSALHAWSQVAYVSGYFFERLRRGWVVDSGRDDHTDSTDGDAPHDASDSSHGSMSGAA